MTTTTTRTTNDRAIEAARLKLQALQNDLQRAQTIREIARERVTAAIKELGEQEYSVGAAVANMLAAEHALQALKPAHLCRTPECWNQSAAGALGHCFDHAPEHSPSAAARKRHQEEGRAVLASMNG